jgi:hypothetical protein
MASFTQVFLTQGDRGDAVRDLQVQLVNAGFDPGQVDGIYGPRTAEAVRQFQAWVGLPETGEVDEATWAVLTENLPRPTESETSPPTPIPEVLREAGSEGLIEVPLAVPPSPAPSPPGGSAGRMATIQSVVDQAARRFGVDHLLVLAVIRAESSFDPQAYNFLSGAAGLMQLTPIAIQDLAQRFGIRVTDPFDVAQNIVGGTALLQAHLSEFGGDVARAVAAFHAGRSRLLRWIRDHGTEWLAAAGQATRRYVQNVLSAWQLASAGEGASGIVRASFQQPGGLVGILPTAFQPTAETLALNLEEVGVPEPVAASAPVLIPVAVAAALVVVMARSSRPQPIPA